MCRFARTVGFLCRVFCAGLLIIHLFPASAFAADYVPGEVLVTFRQAVTPDEMTSFENRHGLTLKRAFRFDPRHRHYLLPSGLTVEQALVKLGADPVVESVTPNYLVKPLAFPTDPRFPEQWYMHNTGQPVNGKQGPANIDINWPEAMDLFTGSAQVIVAVLDSGISGLHPELAFSVWVNSDEINGNGIDDDGNGYADDRLGWDFVDNDGLPFDEGPGGGHGTLVASVIAAGINNGFIGAGVAPTAKIMPLRVLNDLGSGTVINAVAALEYAGLNGARVVNLSLAGAPPTQLESSVLQWLDSRGVLVVAAAGNGGEDKRGDDNDLTPIYPASYPFENIISVAAVDRSGNLALFSNYGATSVDLAAPGTDILGAALKYQTFTLETFQTGAPGWLTGQMPGSLSTLSWSLWQDNLGNMWATDSLFPGTNTQIPYQPFTDSYLLSPSYLIPPGGARVRYRVLHDLAPIFDFLLLEVSPDGTTWQLIDLVYGTGFDLINLGRRTVDVSRFSAQPVFFRFRLLSDSAFQGDGVAIDDFEIQGVALTTYDGTEFQFNDGTSFAAPQVAGVAAMLLAQRPDLTHRQVRDIILNGVTKTTALNGKVATGGQLNALAALQAAIAMPPPPPTNVFSAVLPVSRSAVVGSPVTAFGTIINAGGSYGMGCTVALSPTAPAGLSLIYQTTDPATNRVIGLPNTPVGIAPGAAQSFVVALTPSAPFGPVDLPLVFDCENSPPAPAFVGVNTLLVSASMTPVPDVVALAATLTGDGIVNIPGASGTGVFAVASVNVGAGGAITASTDTGGAALPVSLTLCETNPGTGQCLQPPAGSVAATIASGATPTFAIFARGTGSAVPFNPAVNRVFVRFRDAGGIVRGATSVAVRTQ